MRLQRLEIKGFKSFPDKTIVNFDEKITGIVGPNGCGKSNIIDAIRWVVGEQKIANLRSENLESLVFNGSKTRASSGLAEVTLTFENTKNILPTEYSTVAISRRFYKTGDSEYRLNDVVCRLKDIQNLLLDTGIGSDSYSIIELGMVDDLIKDKDNSRRKLLEQAAGITIYKIRKKEAKQKLDLTQQDLARVSDVLFEIAEQMKTLEVQAKKAEKCNELKKEYKDYSIEFAKISTSKNNEANKNFKIEIQSLNDDVLFIETNMNALNAVSENLKFDVFQKEKLLKEYQHNYNELISNITQIENDKKILIQKKEYVLDKIKNVGASIQLTENHLKQLYEVIALNLVQIKEQEINIKVFSDNAIIQKNKLENIKSEIEIKKEQLEEIRNENKKWQIQQFDIEKKIVIAETSLNNVLTNIKQINIDTTSRREIHKSLIEENLVLNDEILSHQTKLDSLKSINQELKNLIVNQQQNIEKKRENLVIENRILDAKKNEYELLKNMVDKMEGYPESVKFLFNNPNWLNTPIPILSDIIYVQEKYRVTIENFLNNFLNYYVVKKRQDAVLAVELLFSNQKGKANFLILDELNYNLINTPKQKPSIDGVISAMDILEIDIIYKPLFEYLLGNIYIVDDVKSDMLIDFAEELVLIDKNGKIFHQKYSVSGGSIGLFEGNKIGRLKNLEKNLQFIQQQGEKVGILKNEIAEMHQFVVLKNNEINEQEVQQLQHKLNILSNQKFTLDNKIESLLSLDKSENKKIEDLEKHKKNYEESILINKNALESIKINFDESGTILKNRVLEFEDNSKEFANQQDIFNQTNLKYAQKQNHLNSLQQEQKFKSEQVDVFIKNLNDFKLEFQHSIELNEALEIEINNKQIEIFELYKYKEQKNAYLVNEEKFYNEIKFELSINENEFKQLVKSKEINDKRLNDVKDKMTEIKIQMSGVKERLQVEFDVDLELILEQNNSYDFTIEDLKNLIEKTKRKIENLGEINHMAIEAFQEIKNRNDVIVTQKQDIENAKESLLQTIQEVEITANKKFLETFNLVKDNFRKVFKTLFTEEDECDLILENPENLAETGVNILAKPKGKRPSSITQLSGGEKTLTATALLFSIYLIKPAPFCILDEVDAPLDDNNVSKFTNMIRKFSDESQFIIVTHNKSTMSTVDVIYGVTMQELGVSKLVPVDFRSLESV